MARRRELAIGLVTAVLGTFPYPELTFLTQLPEGEKGVSVMRHGLLALSLAMLASGGVAAQSALTVSYSASADAMERRLAAAGLANRHDAVIFTAPPTAHPRLAMR